MNQAGQGMEMLNHSEQQQTARSQTRSRVQTALMLREAIWMKANEWFLADPKIDLQQASLNMHEELSRLESLEKTYGYRSTVRKAPAVSHDKQKQHIASSSTLGSDSSSSSQMYRNSNGLDNSSASVIRIGGKGSPKRHNKHVQEQYTKGKMLIREEMKQLKLKQEEQDRLRQQITELAMDETDQETESTNVNTSNNKLQVDAFNMSSDKGAFNVEIAPSSTHIEEKKDSFEYNYSGVKISDTGDRLSIASGDETESDESLNIDETEDDLVDDFDDED